MAGDKDEGKVPESSANTQPHNPAIQTLLFEYAINVENVDLRTEALAKVVGLSDRQTRKYLTPEFWEAVRDARRKRYARHSVFVDEGLVRGAVKGNPSAARLYYEKFEGWNPKEKTPPGNGHNIPDHIKSMPMEDLLKIAGYPKQYKLQRASKTGSKRKNKDNAG